METRNMLNDFVGQHGLLNVTEMEFLPSYEIDYINFKDLHDFDIYMDIDNPLSDPSKRDKDDGKHTT